MRMWQFQVWFKHFFDSMHQIITNSRVIFVPTPTKICDKGLLDGGLSAADIGCKDEMRKKIGVCSSLLALFLSGDFLPDTERNCICQ